MTTMDVRKALSAVLAVAAVWGLAGWPWAALAAAIALWASPTVLSDVAGRARDSFRSVTVWMADRKAAAMQSMPIGVGLVAVGAGVSYGLGAAVLAAGVLTIGFSIVVGWNA